MADADITGARMVEGLMDVGITGAEGIEGVSMLPYLVAGLGALYTVGRASDNIRYWKAYYKNTGRKPKYPFRSGSMDWMRDAATLGYGFGRLKRL